MISYGFKKEVDLPFDRAVEVVTEEMNKRGFGVLTKIDLKEKFKEKLDIEFPNYVILGTCNPPLAHKAVQAEEDVGLLLPCNVIVYQKERKTVVAIIRPSTAMGMIGNDDLKQVAIQVEARLKEVFDSVK